MNDTPIDCTRPGGPANLSRLFAVLSFLVLIGGLFAGILLSRAQDAHMRADLLRQARMVADSVNLDHLGSLTGTLEDESSPAYLRLKDQLSLICSTNPHCRFIYISGLRAEEVFFYVDSEPPGTANYS